MAVSLKHTFVSAVADSGDTTLVQPSNWNAEHTLTLGSGKLLGRTTALTGAVEEIGAGTNLSLASGSLSVAFGNGTVSAPSIGPSADTDTGIWFPAANTLAVSTGGSEALRVTSAQRVGIGTTTPSYTLDVVTTNTGIGGALIQNSSNAVGAYTSLWFDNDSAGIKSALIKNSSTNATNIGAANSFYIYYNDTGYSGFFNNSATPVVFATNATERMRLDSSGNLLIGTTTAPGDNGKGIAIYASDYPRLSFRNSTTGSTTASGLAMFMIGNDFYQFGPGAKIFGVGSSEHLRLDSSGNLGIGTSSPGSRLTVTQAADGDGIRLNHASRATSTYWLQTLSGVDNENVSFVQFNGTSAVSSYTLGRDIHLWYTGGTERMRLNASGNLGLGVTPSAWGNQPALELPQAASLFGFSSTTNLLQNAYYNGSDWIYKNTAGAMLFQVGRDAHRWFTATSGTAGNAITFTQAMTLDASGRLGIGTTSFSNKLTVNTAAMTNSYDGVVVQYNSSADGLSLLQTGSTYTYGAVGSSEAWLYSSNRSITLMADGASAVLKFATGGNTEKARLDASGNLGLGVTPSGWGASRFALDMGANAYVGGTALSHLTNNVYYDGSNFKYKTTASAAMLQIAGNAYGFYTAPSGTAGGTVSFTQVMTLSSSGNLALGVAPSGWADFKALDLYLGSIAGYTPSGAAIGLYANTYYNGSNYIYRSTNPASYMDAAGAFRWFIAPSGTAGNAITFTQAMTLDASGRLGIGVTSPSYPLDVQGTTNASFLAQIRNLSNGSSASASIALGQDTNASAASLTLGSSTYSSLGGANSLNVYQGLNAPIAFFTNGSERARIHASGGVSIGTATDPSANNLLVNGTIQGTQLRGGYNDTTGSANTAAQALGTNTVSRVLISANTTLTTTVPPAGAHASVIIQTSGNASRTVTFGTGFKSQGTLATGATADRYWVVNFVSDGTNLYETSRTTTAYA